MESSVPQTAFHDFLVTDYPRIVGVVALTTGSRMAAEDAVHEALARAWERRNDIEYLNRWVLAVALNLARSRWRRLRREVLQKDPPDQPSVPAPEAMSPQLLNAVRELPARQREVVLLHYVLDKPIREIAQVTGLTEGGVKHALFRARQSLLNRLSPTEAPDAAHL